MYMCGAILLMIVGYFLLVFAAKQSVYNKLGKFLAIFVMIVGLLGFAKSGYYMVSRCLNHGGGYHKSCKYSGKSYCKYKSKRSHKRHSHSSSSADVTTPTTK